MTPPRLQRLDSSTSLVLPTELVALIFNNLGDYELATTLRIPHSLPTPSPWSEQATPLDQAILASSQSLTPILKALKMGHTDFTQWGARVMIRFSFIHCLDFFVKRDPRQLRQLCGQLLPVVASAWGRVDVLKWATESSFQLRPDAATTAEAMDDASRHGQVAVLGFWKNSGLPLHYSEHALSSATYQEQIGSLEWWKESGLPLKIGYVLDFASMGGSIKCLDWWSSSGLPADYSKAALFHLSKVGNVALLDWWKSSRFPLLFDKEVIVAATRYGQTSALAWWWDSGLEIEYRFFDIEEALEDSLNGKEETQKWWEGKGYVPSLTGPALSEWTRPRKFAQK